MNSLYKNAPSVCQETSLLIYIVNMNSREYYFFDKYNLRLIHGQLTINSRYRFFNVNFRELSANFS